MASSQFEVLEESELEAFFGSRPVERAVEDGYWCYEVTDARNSTLRFSFSVHERSVQTTLLLSGGALSTVSHEGADRMVLQEGKIMCAFSTAGSKTTLTIAIEPWIFVAWSSLRTQ